MLFGEDHRLRPYVAGSLGFTLESNSGGNPARTDFAYNLGGGLKYGLSRHLAPRRRCALYVDVRQLFAGDILRKSRITGTAGIF